VELKKKNYFTSKAELSKHGLIFIPFESTVELVPNILGPKDETIVETFFFEKIAKIPHHLS